MSRCPHLNCLCLLAGSEIEAEDHYDKIKLKCKNGKKWVSPIGSEESTTLVLDYNDAASGEYHCISDSTNVTILVKFRTCDNCIQLDIGSLMGLIIGDILATFFIGAAVYLVVSQPKARAYGSSYSKASDRQNLIQNQQNDTYMPLQGHSSEYSKLERRANRK
ncbi:T-cell surface glycoprotein CD3 gamma chain-like [Brienomyrus brachyistius]|uniref:T-cell surface glycoprotein CD3 gamma chain-like n=1 Tax=Brienomyrus brachyistius TaxID=42636 RepID=UPI0020B1B659|nr:T-cell surface glycoprotein CD3 gamma chain-like [Brienomyrus brachyistius]